MGHMDQPHRIATAVILPPEIAARLSELQQLHDLPPWEPAIPLHITLVSPFTMHETIDSLAARFSKVASDKSPFPIILDGFGRFDNEESVIFARVMPNQTLTQLAEDSFAAVQDIRSSQTHPFNPHVTLAAAAPKEIIDEYMHRTAGEQIHEEFTCDRFALLRLDESARRWEVIREFPFSQ